MKAIQRGKIVKWAVLTGAETVNASAPVLELAAIMHEINTALCDDWSPRAVK